MEFTLSDYLSHPLSQELAPDLVNETTAKAFEKLLTRRSRIYYLKVFYLKRTVRALIREKKLRPFRFRIKRTFRCEAYMLDEGEIVFTYGTFKLSGERIFSTFVHELSHIWLSNLPCYGEMKEFDKLFRRTFAGESFVPLSPIEGYARLAGISVMKRLAEAGFPPRVQNRLLVCLKDEEKKLDSLKTRISNLKNTQLVAH